MQVYQFEDSYGEKKKANISLEQKQEQGAYSSAATHSMWQVNDAPEALPHLECSHPRS